MSEIAEAHGRLRIFFFFQAEDGIRDYKVTGVQTCALPISTNGLRRSSRRRRWPQQRPSLPPPWPEAAGMARPAGAGGAGGGGTPAGVKPTGAKAAATHGPPPPPSPFPPPLPPPRAPHPAPPR